MPSTTIVVGVDVGAEKKGFHAVALQNGHFLDRFYSCEPNKIADWCLNKKAQMIGIDAPCRWRISENPRLAEISLQREHIGCFWTPTRVAALSHPKKNYEWMLNGEKFYKTIERKYRLYDGQPIQQSEMICFETFPQAIACALADKIVSAKDKRTVRTKLLKNLGISIQELTNIDWIDAALCAYTAHSLTSNNVRTYGEIKTGLIVVPNIQTNGEKSDMYSRVVKSQQ